MQAESFKELSYADDFDARIMLIEKDSLRDVARVISFSGDCAECSNYGVYHTFNHDQLRRIGFMNWDEWRTIDLERYLQSKKYIGSNLQNCLERVHRLIGTEPYECYGGTEFIMHFPNSCLTVSGPSYRYSSTEREKRQYFIKVDEADGHFYKNIPDGVSRIANDQFAAIFDTWSPFLSFLMTDSIFAFKM